jgi:hypothetical protein
MLKRNGAQPEPAQRLFAPLPLPDAAVASASPCARAIDPAEPPGLFCRCDWPLYNWLQRRHEEASWTNCA